MVKSSFRVATRQAGAKCLLKCDRNAVPQAAGGDKREKLSTGTGCRWQSWIEEAKEGWVVKDWKPHDDSCDHNHDLCGSNADLRASSKMRSIPDYLLVFADMLKKSGQGPASINDFLKSVAADDGIPITWTYDDVYNHFSLSAQDKFLDASRMVDWVESRTERGLPAAIHVNSAMQLERVFFAPKGAREFWAKSPTDNVMIYDTTFSTNRAGMKLGCGTGVNEEGLSNLLFVSLVCFQDHKSFEWVFENFMQAFRHAPRVVFTDSDGAMELAIQNTLAIYGSAHLLCTWHLSKNVATNMKPTACGKWTLFSKKWWRICKDSSLLSQQTFDNEWDELIQILPTIPEDKPDSLKSRQKALAWLETLKDKKERWAARYTWQFFTAGVHSTQRAESVHSNIKRFLGATSLLVVLADSLMKHSENIDDQAALKTARSALIATSKSMQRDMPAVAAVSGAISTHAMEVLRAQQAQHIAYKLAGPFQAPGASTFWTVVLDDTARNKSVVSLQNQIAEDYGLPVPGHGSATTHVVTWTSCSCQFPTCWGMPCRHMLRLYMQAGVTTIPAGVIRQRWVNISPEEAQSRTKRMLQGMALPIDQSSATPRTRPMNQQERFSYCNAESKAVAELASLTKEGMDIFIQCLDLCKDRLRNVPIPDIREEHASTAQTSIAQVLPPPTTHRTGKPQHKRKRAVWER